MSGHSKWHSIKHKKAAVDAKRGKLFSRLVKEIVIAARMGGGDADTNPRLRTAVQAAKAVNMPSDNIQRAVRRGTGDLPGVSYEEVTYEGYAPGGVAVLVEVLTDNRNRAAAEVRTVFNKRGGSLAGLGSVAWLFKKKGLITVERSAAAEDDLLGIALEAGAEDFKAEDRDLYEIITALQDFEAVRRALEEKGVPISAASVTAIPQSTVKVAGKDAGAVLSLMNSLEELDDVQNIYANFDIPDEILEGLERA